MKGFVISLKGLARWPFIIANVLLITACLTGVFKFTGPLSTIHAATVQAWAVGTHYNVNDQVTFEGNTYICLQSNNALPGWDPVSAPALWKLATAGSPLPPKAPVEAHDQSTASSASPQTFAGGCTSGPQDTWTRGDGVFYQGKPKGNKKEVALTFDDGPFGTVQTTHNTQAILNILQQNKIHATFFVIGEQVTSDPELLDPTQVDSNSDQVKLVNEEKNDGNEVADHTWTHADLTDPSLPLTPNPNNPGSKHDVQDEIQMTKTVIKNAIGTTPKDFRPPYGDTNQAVQNVAKGLKLTTIGWTIDSCDWTQTLTGGVAENDIVNNVLNFVKSGTIVLMHDGGNDRSQTVAALPTIIQSLKNQGYQFVTVHQMVVEAAQK